MDLTLEAGGVARRYAPELAAAAAQRRCAAFEARLSLEAANSYFGGAAEAPIMNENRGVAAAQALHQDKLGLVDAVWEQFVPKLGLGG